MENLKEEIIKNPVIVNDYLNNIDNISKIVGVLCKDNDDIPNSVYLTNINGNCILDELLKRNLPPFLMKQLTIRIQENIELINYYFKYGICFDLSIVPFSKLLEIQDNRTNLDLLISNIKSLRYYNLFGTDSNYFIESLKKLFDKQEIRNVVINSFITNINNWNDEIITILSCLINKMSNEEIIKIFVSDKVKIIDYFKCMKSFRVIVFNKLDASFIKILIDNFIQIFEFFNDELLKKIDDNKLILDYLLESDKLKSCESLYRKIIKLSEGNVSYALILLNHHILCNSFYDFNMNNIYTYQKCLVNTLKKINDKDFYNNYFKPFIIKNKLSIEFLLYRFQDRTVLEMLLKIDSIENIKQLLVKNKLDRNYQINLILRLNNIELDDHSILDFDENIYVEYNDKDKKLYEPYLLYSMELYDQELINKFITLFNDNISDESVVKLVVNSFIYRFNNNCEYTRRDLETIIKIKKNIKKFYLMEGYYCGFSEQKIDISRDRLNSISSIIHELTHAIHFYTKSFETPEEFKKKNFKINQKNYEEFIKIFKYKIGLKKIEIHKNNHDYYNDCIGINNLVKNHQEVIEDMLKSAEKNSMYSKEVIDYLKNNYVVEEEFHKHYNDYFIRKLAIDSVDAYFRCIIDIVDALKEGIIFDNGIEIDEKVEKIGHGSKYYSRSSNIFGEILANYSVIINSHFKDEALIYLESIVGSELIEILDNYYKDLSYDLDEVKKR